MAQVTWRDKSFQISQRTLTALKELPISYKVKKKSDKSGNSVIITGHDLQTFSVSYDLSASAGVNPMQEYDSWKLALGQAGPLMLENTLYGPDYVMLKNVQIESDRITSTGVLLTASLTLEFEEYDPQTSKTTASARPYVSPLKRNYFSDTPEAVEDLIIKVLYNGKDITDSVSVSKCVHDMFASSQADTLKLIFNDTTRLWDGWKAENEDLIEVVYGVARTGMMFIDDVKPVNGAFELRASSIPPNAKEKHTKSWENVYFTQIAQEISNRHGLELQTFGVEDAMYDYVCQENEPDFIFLQKRCDLESLSFLVFDKKLVIYSEDYLDSQESQKEIEINDDIEFEYNDNSQKGLGTFTVTNGNITGTYKSSNGLEKSDSKVIQTHMSSTAEANRFAKGIWRVLSKNLASGYFKDAIMRDLSAGSILTLKTDGASSWDGKVFVNHIRQDYVGSNSKVFFRKANVS
jgi:hypothetical protein